MNTEHYLYTELQALLKRDGKFFEFLENSSLAGTWFWDLENPKRKWMSPAFWQTLGYSVTSKHHPTIEWQNIIHQDDLKSAFKTLEKHCADSTHPYEQVVRYFHKNGKTIWIQCRGLVVRDDAGKPTRMIGTFFDITDIKEQEVQRNERETAQMLALKKQAELLSELEQTANIGTWEVNLIANTVIWSDQTKLIHEVPEDFQPSIEAGVNFYKAGESQQLIAEAVEQGISYGKSWKLELELVTFKGRNIWVRAHGKPLFTDGQCTGLFGVFQDITEQKEAEARIKIEREKAVSNSIRLQLANDAIEMGVWEWDLRKDELHWDEWMYRLYGVCSSDFSGAVDAWEQSVHPDDIESAKTLLSEALSKGTLYDTEFRIVLSTGQIKYIKANAKVVFNDNNTPIKMIGVNYDISERAKTLAVLEQEKLKAESAAQAKSDFLANMSHEIRTPMNAILGGLQLLKGAELEANLETIRNNAAFSAHSLLTIINDILDYSKIESNKLSIEQVPFSLIEVLESIKYDVDSLVSNKGIRFDIEIDNNFVDGWLGDVVRIKQIILNLTSNAVKFTNQGTVKIQVSCCDFKGTNAIRVSVVDSGIGMTEEAKARIFDRFSQADSSTTRKYGGTGLGMSIALSLIEMMHGDIELNTVCGEGTTVTVLLPLKQSTLDAKAQRIKSLIAPLMIGKKVLVAEDNMINQVIVKTMLEPTKAFLKIVENGVQAVNAVKEEDFDIILMDIHMPEMDGQDAQQAIATLKPYIPVVALTANVMPEDVAQYLKQGFASHLPKPLDMNMLYGLLLQYN